MVMQLPENKCLNRGRLRLAPISDQVLNRDCFFAVAPDRWITAGRLDLLVSAFNYISPPQEFMAQGYFIELERAVILFAHGRMQRVGEFERGRIKNNEEGLASVTPRVLDPKTETHTDWWVVLIQPLSSLTEDELTATKEERVKICAMISATMGPAAVYHHEVESIYSSAHYRVNATLTTRAVPDFVIKDSTSAEKKFLRLETFTAAVARANDTMRGRLDVALHWYDLGHRTDGLEQFINYWVALEALCFEGSSNIRSVNKPLGKIYGLDSKTASNFFGVGRIANLRSEILHGKYRLTPSAQLSFYLRELIADLLNFKLGLPNEERARIFLRGRSFDASGIIDQGPPRMYAAYTGLVPAAQAK
jgi:hypothetical protein